jgi:hypothetical protein
VGSDDGALAHGLASLAASPSRYTAMALAMVGLYRRPRRSRPWLESALISAVWEAKHLPARNLALGIIHGDGAAVIEDPTANRISVIDRGTVMWGPLLYDIAVA